MSEVALETNESMYVALAESEYPIRFYLIERADGDTYHTYAHGYQIHENGNLVFYSNAKKDLEYAAGRWVAVQEVSEEEFDRA